MENNDAYVDLANAIIVQQARDYMKALRMLKKYPDKQYYLDQIADIEDFFHSDQYAILTDADPDYILEKMREKVDKEEDDE